MDQKYLDAVTRQLATSRSRRQILATTGRGVVGGLGAAMIARGFDLGLLDGEPAPSASAQGVTVRMLDLRYDPGTITVPVGSEVTWVNDGTGPHSATSSPAGTFDTGIVDPGDEGSHTFTTTGTVKYFCRVHGATMGGTVEVVEGTPTPPPILQRRNVHSFGTGDKTLESYATAVGIMKGWNLSTDANDFARSWRYQGNIHMTWDLLVDLDRPEPPEPPTPDPLPAGWGTCEHGFGEADGYTPYFWPWHRMYLYWFERIVRKLSDDPTFALPYWDYSVADNRILPAPFLDDSSHLWVAERDSGVNSGTMPVLCPAGTTGPGCVPESIFSPCGGMTLATYDDAASAIEGTPHGGIHVWVGGTIIDETVAGWMSLPWKAARDPIFWLHHANIDRLWESWVAKGNANPTHQTWLKHDQNDGNNWFPGEVRRYRFFDEDGKPVDRIRVVEEVLTTTGLGYEYDALFDPDDPEVCPAFMLAPLPSVEAGTVTPVATPEVPLELGRSAPEEGIAIGPDLASVPVTVAQPEAAVASVEAGGSIILTIEGINGTGVPSVVVEVYINLKGSEADFRSPYYVGNLNLFGIVVPSYSSHTDHVYTQRFNISRNVAALDATREWTGDVEVTFVPYLTTALAPPAAAAAGATPAAMEIPFGPWVTVESVSVATRSG